MQRAQRTGGGERNWYRTLLRWANLHRYSSEENKPLPQSLVKFQPVDKLLKAKCVIYVPYILICCTSAKNQRVHHKLRIKSCADKEC